MEETAPSPQETAVRPDLLTRLLTFSAAVGLGALVVFLLFVLVYGAGMVLGGGW